tara:strand:- start:1499 stop:1747 length:249 start_codon:yes stop_codon:yes gene_type:complete
MNEIYKARDQMEIYLRREDATPEGFKNIVDQYKEIFSPQEINPIALSLCHNMPSGFGMAMRQYDKRNLNTESNLGEIVKINR